MQIRKAGTTEIILSTIALILLALIFFKAIIDIDTNYDVGWYHHFFAARIWGIISESSFISEDSIEYRYQGFPLLAHFFQGLLWKLTGRIQATNLVGYLSLIIYFFWLRNLFKVPFYFSVIGVFTIPAVLTHASTSMVDLPGNVGAAVLMMMVYRFFIQFQLPSKTELLSAALGAAVAVNTKPQLQPLVFVMFWIVGIRLLWLYFKNTTQGKRRLWLTVPLSLIISMLIFATPLKNVALYSNPFYPIKVEVLGKILNHKLTPQTYNEGDRPQKWLRSVLEINTPPKWTADQWNGGDDRYLDRAGGFFGFYVIFNFVLLLGLSFREILLNRKSGKTKSHKAKIALATILLVSLIPANFPQSHELRYLMFWMITLVSLNLCLLSGQGSQDKKWFQPKYVAFAYLFFLVIVCVKIDKYYLRPVFNSLDDGLDNIVKTELLDQMIPNRYTCMIVRHNVPNPKKIPFASSKDAIYYSSYFHPEINYSYSIKAATKAKGCRQYPVIPRNVRKF